MAASFLHGIRTRLAPWVEWTLFRLTWSTSRVPILTTIGLLLLGVASFLWSVWEPRVVRQVARVQQELANKRGARPAPARQISTLETVAMQLEALGARSVIGSDIFMGFTAQGVRVDQVVFGKDTEEAEAEDVRSVHLQATVIGVYPAIKAGLASLLQQHPSLALESATFTKNGGNEKSVTADLAFVLWYRGR